MELRHYLQVLGRRKWVVIITTIVTLAIVSAATFLMTPIYSASATIRIAQIQDRSIDYFDLNYSVRLINTYVELVRSRPFLQQTIDRLGLNIGPKDLADAVQAEALPNTELLRISAENSNADIAMMIANTLGELLVEEGARLYSGQGKSSGEILFDQLVAMESSLKQDRVRFQELLTDVETDAVLPIEAQYLETQILLQEQIYGTILDAYENERLSESARESSVRVVDDAMSSTSPIRPNVTLNLLLGAVIGLMGGVGLAFLFENLDTSIYTPRELEEGLAMPLLGSIPNFKVPSRLRNSPLLLKPNGKSSAGEAFRILRSNVLAMDYGRPPRSVLIASFEEDAGKSTVLANLAVALGQAGKRVVVVDSDFRDPSLSSVFGVQNNLGLKNVIMQSETFEDVIQVTDSPGVKVLTSGPLPHNPAEFLGLLRLQQLVEDLANWADMVLLDSPPLEQYSDSVVLAPLVDCVVLVASPGGVSVSQVQSAVAQFAKVGVDQLGIVFNRGERA